MEKMPFFVYNKRILETHTPTLLLAWEAPSQIDHERSPRWYLIAGILTLTFVAYSLAVGAWTAAVVAVLAAGAYVLVRNQKHRTLRIGITEEGLIVDGVLSPWEQWDSFWILASKDVAMLHLAPKKKRNGEFRVLTGDIDPFLLRDILSRYLPHDAEKTERFFDMIIRFCKL